MPAKRKKGRLRRAAAWLFRLTVVAAGVWLLYEAWRFPDVGALRSHDPGTTALMRYREREARRKGQPFHLDRRWVPLHRTSPNLRRAVIAAEDARFYQHQGFDADAIRDALDDSLQGKRLRGASTISQQVAKNLWLDPERAWLRKAREAAYTWVLERRLSKDRILEIYLNVAEWGPGIFGAEAAARRYFGVAASELTPMQSALLAASLPSPLVRDPGHPSRFLQKRSRLILARMGEPGAPQPSPPPATPATSPADLLSGSGG
jgi:monofunctional biosynthetic peptidoglycan transglycosylase